jgi:hypothetical protein|tara:strand:+ start:5258 stop:5548 length:291 start_codon:yes stop_codon:yes gene_type:complete
MTPLKYDNQTFYYKEIAHADESGSWVTTLIFDSPTMKRPKYWIFGELIEVENRNPLGEMNFAITSIHKSKSDIKKSLAKILGIEGRREEINKGDLI